MNKKDTPTNRTLPVIALLLMLVAFGCGKDKKEVIEAFTDPNEVPTIYSKDVSTLISDSGVTRYRVVAPDWYMYENSETPRWYFPRGIYLETFDDDYNVAAFLEGDTAIFYKSQRLWEIRGDVKMANTNDERFFTEQLFWSQDAKKIYSDTIIHIERGDRIIEGLGFESNQNMTQYKILKTTGIFPVEDMRRKDTISTNALDTLKQESAIKNIKK
ncbi:MAG: LPS export ABC transporter periplasmic protein LptC [Bacteroidales bacterium]|nr:LPS export ABC transporter periplasmic protein LptC [Bacteroidales bacterium]MBQ3576065.1 LPS export ABC transporter periplasmic protein LptC [Coprobacter sp.]